ncbi:helix-turn-helix domain-containing protein [Blautia sp.]
MKQKKQYGPECAQRLDHLMTELNLKNTDLAELANYSPQQIRNYRSYRRSLTAEGARAIAPFLGVRPEYLLCEDNCKTLEEFNNLNIKKEISDSLKMSVAFDIAKLTTTIVKKIETDNENYFISTKDYNEFRKDISDYIQMRTEKWLLPRLKEKQDPEA